MKSPIRHELNRWVIFDPRGIPLSTTHTTESSAILNITAAYGTKESREQWKVWQKAGYRVGEITLVWED